QLDDLVMTRTLVPKAGEVRTYGVVSEVQAVYEGASYESDTHRIAAEGILPGAKGRSATGTVTRVDPEVWVAPDPGGVVERARGGRRGGAGGGRGAASRLVGGRGGRAAAGGAGARRRAGAPGPGLLRRPQGRPHVDLRRLGGRDQDVVRAVLPADADVAA